MKSSITLFLFMMSQSFRS